MQIVQWNQFPMIYAAVIIDRIRETEESQQEITEHFRGSLSFVEKLSARVKNACRN